MRYVGEEEATQVMGLGCAGQVAQGIDGNLYQWVQGVDGLGNPVGWGWALRRLRRAAKRPAPLAQRLAPLVPGPYGAAVATALRTANPVLRQAGIAGANGLGALYQAPNGAVYQVQGLAEDEELRGFAQEEELRGFAEDEELRGLTQAEELQGLSQGYVREAGTSGLEAYAPEQPPQTRWFASPAQPPEMWKPLW